jgi:hypothetical protein
LASVHTLKFASHFRALMLGMKKYSPPRSTLNVSMPWMRRLTGSFGMVKVAPALPWLRSLVPTGRSGHVRSFDQ